VTIQSGTRCGCLNVERCHVYHREPDGATSGRCGTDAVRMVTVRETVPAHTVPFYACKHGVPGGCAPGCGTEQVPMCEPCAQYHESGMAQTGGARLKGGQTVWLKADKAEGWERQRAKVLEIQDNGTILVEVSPEEEGDDGLREVTVDQIEGGAR
jgi:hypothetical protein